MDLAENPLPRCWPFGHSFLALFAAVGVCVLIVHPLRPLQLPRPPRPSWTPARACWLAPPLRSWPWPPLWALPPSPTVRVWVYGDACPRPYALPLTLPPHTSYPHTCPTARHCVLFVQASTPWTAPRCPPCRTSPSPWVVRATVGHDRLSLARGGAACPAVGPVLNVWCCPGARTHTVSHTAGKPYVLTGAQYTLNVQDTVCLFGFVGAWLLLVYSVSWGLGCCPRPPSCNPNPYGWQPLTVLRVVSLFPIRHRHPPS